MCGVHAHTGKQKRPATNIGTICRRCCCCCFRTKYDLCAATACIIKHKHMFARGARYGTVPKRKIIKTLEAKHWDWCKSTDVEIEWEMANIRAFIIYCGSLAMLQWIAGRNLSWRLKYADDDAVENVYPWKRGSAFLLIWEKSTAVLHWMICFVIHDSILS